MQPGAVLMLTATHFDGHENIHLTNDVCSNIASSH